MIFKNFFDKQVFIYDLWKILSNVFYIFLIFFLFLFRKQIKYRMLNFFFYQIILMNIENFMVGKDIKIKCFEVSDMINKYKNM